MRQYIALIHKDRDSDYGVSFPDFPGCVTAGSTLDEARAMAEEALALHIEGLIEDGEALPDPMSLDAVMAEAESRGAVAALVPAKTDEARAVRVNITLPEDVLAAADRYAEINGLTRSGLINLAVKKVIGKAA